MYTESNLSLPSSLLALAILFLIHTTYKHLFSSPLKQVPGPWLYTLTRWRLAYDEYRGVRTHSVHRLHQKYGPVVRVSPSEVSFNSLAALRTIYGPGGDFHRDPFYGMFDAYGRKVLFSFIEPAGHRERKKQVNKAYTKTAILSPQNISNIEDKTRDFLALIERESVNGDLELFSALHYFAMDTVSQFIYGDYSGPTTAMKGSASPDRNIIDEMLDPARRRLFCSTVHFPRLTNWFYTLVESVLRIFHRRSMPKSRLTALREHTLLPINQLNKEHPTSTPSSLLSHLLTQNNQQPPSPASMDPLDIIAECSDHFLAGIDTTSNTLTFLLYSLSQPEHHPFQDTLRAELASLSKPTTANNPNLICTTTAEPLPYLDAVIKETLRLYAPSPGSEPRWSPNNLTIDGYRIPARTTVSMSPYTLHRNGDVFKDPLRFNPNRWLGPAEEVNEMKKWFWAFSGGSRMCVGVNLAMAEMKTLLASIYRMYRTEIAPEFVGTSPGMSHRGDLFYDERLSRVEEHACWIRFVRDR